MHPYYSCMDLMHPFQVSPYASILCILFISTSFIYIISILCISPLNLFAAFIRCFHPLYPSVVSIHCIYLRHPFVASILYIHILFPSVSLHASICIACIRIRCMHSYPFNASFSMLTIHAANSGIRFTQSYVKLLETFH